MSNIQQNINQLLSSVGSATRTLYGKKAIEKLSPEEQEVVRTKGEQSRAAIRQEQFYMRPDVEAVTDEPTGEITDPELQKEELELAEEQVRLQKYREDIDPKYFAQTSAIREKQGETLEERQLKNIRKMNAQALAKLQQEANEKRFREQVFGSSEPIERPNIREVIKYGK